MSRLMDEPHVSFEVAQLMKEMNFPFFERRMGLTTEFYHARTRGTFHLGHTGRIKEQDLYWKPTQALLQKWLRDVHQKIVYCTPYYVSYSKLTLWFSNYMLPQANDIESEQYGFTSYEQALDFGLLEALKQLKAD